MPRTKQPKEKVSLLIYNHPDREEIITKLVSDVPCADIAEWLEAKYTSVGEQQFTLSQKTLQTFKDEYLDFYSVMKNDLGALSKPNIAQELQASIDSNPKYKQALQKYAESELDLKTIVKQLVSLIEIRLEQVFDTIQDDPRNFKGDRTLIEYIRLLNEAISTSNDVLNDSPDQINIQNNINIQMLDKHTDLISNLIRDILQKLDYDTSLVFIDMFNEGLSKLKTDDATLPIEERLQEVQVLSSTIEKKLSP